MRRGVRERVMPGIARNATEASAGVLSGQCSQLHVEKLSLATAGRVCAGAMGVGR